MDKSSALKIIRKVREDYNTMTVEWDKSRFVPSALKIKMVKFLKPDWRILDVGCGNGFILDEVLKKKIYYEGLDISRELIKIAKKKFANQIRLKRAKFVVGNALNLPQKNNSFNAVLSFAVLHHIPTKELRIKFLKEIKRVLENGGVAKITVWNLKNNWAKKRFNIDAQLKNTPSGLEKGDVYVDWKATTGKIIKRYLHVFSKGELIDLIKEVGFKKFKVDYCTRAGVKKKNGEEIFIELKK